MPWTDRWNQPLDNDKLALYKATWFLALFVLVGLVTASGVGRVFCCRYFQAANKNPRSSRTGESRSQG